MSNPETNNQQQENQSLLIQHWNQQMTALREEHNAQLVALQQSQQLLTQQLAIQAQELQKLRNLDPPNDVPRVRSSFRCDFKLIGHFNGSDKRLVFEEWR